MYGKIFDSMYEGTLYGHWEAIVTLQQMLVLCNSEGVIDMTPQAIAARTSIPLEILTKGIGILTEPDPYSRTPGDDGKRIVLMDNHRPWGWFIVNYAKYQKIRSREEKLEADRVRIAEKRKTSKNIYVADSRIQTQPVANVAPTATATPKATTREKKSAPQTPLPADFKISERVKAWAAEKGFTDLEPDLEFFTGRMKANGKTYADWDEAFMNCVREDWPGLRKEKR